MHPEQEGSFAGVVERSEVFHHVHQVAVGLVVGAADASGPVMIAELQHERGQIVGQHAVVDPGDAQCVAHRHVSEQRRRRHDERPQRHQRLQQVGIVEQPIGPFLEHDALQARAAGCVAARQGERDDQQVLRPQTTAYVGQNHAQASL